MATAGKVESRTRRPGFPVQFFGGFDGPDGWAALLVDLDGIAGSHPQALQPHLAASTGSACTTGIPEPSHVLRAIGLEGSEAEASVRFSLGFHTTDSDIDEAVCLIRKTLERIFRHR